MDEHVAAISLMVAIYADEHGLSVADQLALWEALATYAEMMTTETS